MPSSRRSFMESVGLLGLAVSSPSVPAVKTSHSAPPSGRANLESILERYGSFGDKASGGTGDTASGVWLEETLAGMGYDCHRQSIDVPFFEVKQATLACGTAHATVIPQAIVAPTGPNGLTAPLREANAHDLSGSIALIVLPFKRWVGLADPQIAKPMNDAIQRGAAGIVMITTGPTREAIALNVSAKHSAIQQPIAILAPKDAEPFLAAAGQSTLATLTLDGRGGSFERRPAFNLIAKLDRGVAQTLIISTPRSGWFNCAAERGSGLAVWLSLAQWLSRSPPEVNVELLATSGHEYDYLGGELYLKEAAPRPSCTKLWVHIGASAAARDWHELGPSLLPLPSPDAQRVLTATAEQLDRTRDAFQGITGLEATYLADVSMAGGELVNVLSAGYRSAIGLYGIHRFFHTRGDDRTCITAPMVEPLVAAFQLAIASALQLE
jgi:hypothetical protein